MSNSNIFPLDIKGLTQVDKIKLDKYKITSITLLNIGDHIRYTSNIYKESGRKIAYAVVHGVDLENNIIVVNSYTKNDEEAMYPNWKIDVSNKFKNYVLYSIKNYIKDIDD